MGELAFEKLVDIKELSEITGMSQSIIKSAKEQGLPFYKIGRTVKFKVSETFKWIEQRKQSK